MLTHRAGVSQLDKTKSTVHHLFGEKLVCQKNNQNNVMRPLLLLVVGFLLTIRLSGQNILVSDFTTAPPNGVLSVNLVTCEITTVADNLNIGNFVDIWMTPDGTLYLLGYGPSPTFAPTLYAHNTTTNATTPVATMGFNFACSMFGLSDTTLLINTSGQFWLYNIPQNTTTLLGTIPGGSFCGFWGEIFEYNGNLYVGVASGSGGAPPGTYQINLGPPLTVTLTTLSQPYPAVSVCGNVFGSASGADVLAEHNFNAPPNSPNQSNWLCLDDFNNSGFGSLAPDPLNATGPLCDCVSESGSYTSFSLFSNCNQDPIVLPYDGTATLDPDDNLVFMIATLDYSNSPDIGWNVLATYNSPVITFIPGVTELGELYSVYIVAADALGNGVDLSDPCAEVSRSVVVRWDESPSVSFTAPPALCANGQCQTVQVSLEGQPPFTLSYRVTAGSSVQNLTQVFNSNNGTIQVCPPTGYSGAVNVEATSITTPTCSCN
jgi:hypothetical protein